MNKKTHIFTFYFIFFAILINFCNNYLPFISATDSLVEFKGMPTHIFTHCLIAYPEIAYSKSNPMAKYYKQDCITSNDFNSLLKKLYNNNYILINPNSIFEKKNNKIIKKKLYIPKNKRPLILSFDDVNYDSKKIGKGMVDKLIVKNGNIFSQTIINNKKHVADNLEFVNLLENFISLKPDFSFCGAKGMINLTGYDGVFGYRTQAGTDFRDSEITKAKDVANVLRKKGWCFASHSYAHAHMKNQSVEQFERDLTKWKNEVENIVGKTKIYVFPYGECDLFENGFKNKKTRLLEKFGFELFCGVGFNRFFGQLPFDKNRTDKLLFMDRTPYDGQTLSNKKKELDKLLSSSN